MDLGKSVTMSVSGRFLGYRYRLLPKSPLSLTPDLLFLVEKRRPAGAGFWVWFWTGLPHSKKRKSFFFLWRAKKRELIVEALITVTAALTDTD